MRFNARLWQSRHNTRARDGGSSASQFRTATVDQSLGYSHSIVAGGLPEMS